SARESARRRKPSMSARRASWRSKEGRRRDCAAPFDSWVLSTGSWWDGPREWAKLFLNRHQFAVRQMFFEHLAEFVNIDIAFTTHEHERTVGAKISIPLADTLIRPGWIVGRQMLVAQAGQIGPEAHIGLVHRHAAGHMLPIRFTFGVHRKFLAS